MLKQDKIRFIESLCDEVKAGLVADVLADKIPSGWDGAELRQYIADRFENRAIKMERWRKRRYNNDVIVRGL